MDELLWGFAVPLEIRRRGSGARLRGSFPYGKTAILSDGGRNGRPRKERFAARAFRFNVEAEDVEINLLSGHSFDRPLASKLRGSLRLRDTDEALSFEADITAEVAATSHGADTLALINAGLATGISPGFRLPPERAVPREKAESIEEEPIRPEDGMHGALIRTVHEALLFELSIVTRPAYPEAQVEARCWTPTKAASVVAPAARFRWRA